jgi:putative membrane protein
MTMFLSNHIAWIKAFHVIAVIAWMSGMFYLPRLFVYHTETMPGSPESERFKVMERRLLKAIVNPSMIAT